VGTVNVNIFNTISMGFSSGDFHGPGTPNFSIDYCIDSDGSINSRDGGAVGCLTSHNETDDDTKSSDGDWIIFRDITTSPYDFRLAYNDYNEAKEMHASGSGSGLSIPLRDLIGKPRESSYSCGAYQMPWIVEEDGNYDYTTLSGAVTANKLNIEIWGAWDSAESATIYVNDQYCYIEAIGGAKHPGYRGASPTHHRLAIGSNCIIVQHQDVVIIGLDVNLLTGASFNVGMSAWDTTQTHDISATFRDCIVSSDSLATTLYGFYIEAQDAYDTTANFINCITSNFPSGHGFYAIASNASSNTLVNMNSCTSLGNGSGIYGYTSAGTTAVNIFNSILMGNSSADIGALFTVTYDIHYTIESKTNIPSRDSGAVGCLSSMNDTDDDTKSSDGDWIIFENITTHPYSLFLVENDYNEALNAHTVIEHSAAGMMLPGRDIAGNPRYLNATNFAIGAHEDVPTPIGSVCWGHVTGVEEDNTVTMAAGSTGTGVVSGSGDAEILAITGEQTREYGPWKLGAGKAKMLMDKYDTGTGGLSLEYKSGATEAACEADTWHSYTGKFVQSGWVKIRVKIS